MKSKLILSLTVSTFLLTSLCPAASTGFPIFSTSSISDIVENVDNSVVKVYSYNSEKSDFTPLFEDFFNTEKDDTEQAQVGSGFVIDSNFAITNAHVVNNNNTFMIIFKNESKLFATLVGKDEGGDIALLKLQTDKLLSSTKIGDSSKLKIGDCVIAIGNPLDVGLSVTIGIISGLDRIFPSSPYINFIQTDASINKGNSGGPLFNMDGEVIGINSAIKSPNGGSVGIGFAIPSNEFMPIIDQLKKYHEVKRGWLGINIFGIDSVIKDGLNLKNDNGVFILSLNNEEIGKKYDFKIGDVITNINGVNIKTPHDLTVLIGSIPIGQSVNITFIRNGIELKKSIVLEKSH